MSCGDYLELAPDNQLVEDEFWQNKEHVASAVAGCYSSMTESGFMDRIFYWGEARAEMILSSSNSSANNLMKNYMVPSNSFSSWANFYETINYCNTVLAFADQAQAADPTFTLSDLNRYKAEVTVIRSFCYFILVKNFQGVPLVVNATLSDQSDFYPARSTEQEVIDKITQDISSVIAYLPETDPTSVKADKGRIGKPAAYAILADTYLWNRQYDKCISACDTIIAYNKYTLVDGTEWFNSIFFEGNSSEGIFELQYDELNTNLYSKFYPAISSKLTLSPEILNLYSDDAEDIRGLDATYSVDKVYGLTGFKYAGVDAMLGTTRSVSEFYNTWIFYRYADVLLMQAEALCLSETNINTSLAYDRLNEVHERACGKPSEAESSSRTSILSAILLERQKEFGYEGKRWYDLLRHASRDSYEDLYLITEMAEINTTADNYEAIMSYYSDTLSFYLPINQTELDRNSNLVQSPYYEN